MAAGGFTFPFFHEYPPYFTLQPVKETKDKQCQLWGALILSYCKHYKIYVLSADGAGDETALFKNDKINRKLNTEARRAFFNYLVVQGNGVWLDQSQQQFLVLWKKIGQWADTIYEWMSSYGLEDSVMTVDELSHGDDTSGTELEGLHREVVVRAIRVLEERGKARMFQGTTADDEGIKFFP